MADPLKKKFYLRLPLGFDSNIYLAEKYNPAGLKLDIESGNSDLVENS